MYGDTKQTSCKILLAAKHMYLEKNRNIYFRIFSVALRQNVVCVRKSQTPWQASTPEDEIRDSSGLRRYGWIRRSARKWGLSARHDLKPNITTERTFLRRPRLSETRVSDTGGWAVSRADMLAAVYYRDGGMVGVEEHWFNAGVIGRPDVSMSTPPSTANAFPPF